MTEICPYPCQNKTEYGYCKTTGCINICDVQGGRMTEVKSLYDIGFEHGYAKAKEDIVRCKDCAYWDRDWITSSNDPNWHYCVQNDTNFEADDFCSRGERKDEVEE